MADFLLPEEERETFEDFLWLRYLEAENNENNDLIEPSNLQRESNTLFTLTKRLRRETDDEDFGFQINYTKPISICSITKSAEKCHLEEGDLIIFVNNVNVVNKSRNEIDSIFSSIKTDQSLILEIFRRKKKVQTQTESSVEYEKTLTTKVEVVKEILTPKCSADPSKKSMKHLTFMKNESNSSVDSQRSSQLLQNLAAFEKKFIDHLDFGHIRYVEPLLSRRDLISSKDHDILFSNIENIKSMMKKIDRERECGNPEIFFQSYRKEWKAFNENFQSYFSTLKIADTIIVDKTHHPNFIKFITNPPIPSNQPVFHNFIQRPLVFFQDLQKNLQIISGYFKVDSHEYRDLNNLIQMLQASYESALKRAAENQVEIKPVLKALESRLVFTKCKPFQLDVHGRVFIFAGDLTRIEKKKEYPTYTLLFNDILLFSTINRDRVLFITEDPIYLKAITESFFNIREKENEFRLTIETNPNYKDLSPTTQKCTPDIIIKRSPLREQSRKKVIYLRAQNDEVKKIWQNFISQSVFNINNSFSETSLRNLEAQLPLKSCNQQNNSSLLKLPELSLPCRKSYSVYSNQLNLKSQNAIDLDSLTEPPCANLLLNEEIQKSLSFSSSTRNESCEGIFDFECDFFVNLNEDIFEDPFFFDETIAK